MSRDLALVAFLVALIGMVAVAVYAVSGSDAGNWSQFVQGFIVELILMGVALVTATAWAES